MPRMRFVSHSRRGNSVVNAMMSYHDEAEALVHSWRQQDVTVTKTFRFEAAHKLVGHKGPCANLHGHSYVLEVSITGPLIGEVGPRDRPEDASSKGMVIDFGDLSALVRKEIIEHLDHKFLASRDQWQSADPEELASSFETYALDIPRTTAEHLVLWIARRLEKAGLGRSLSRVVLWETATGRAEWNRK